MAAVTVEQPATQQTSNGALVLAAYASFVLLGWTVVLLPSLIRSVEADFQQTDAAFGVLYFVSAVLYTGGSLGGGFLTERAGRRLVLAGSACLMAIGLAGESLAPTWAALLAAALFVSLGAGAIDGGMNGLVLALFSDERGGAMNRLHLAYSLGALVAPAALGQFVSTGVHWRVLVLAPALVALALSALLATTRMPSGRHGVLTIQTDQPPDITTEQSLLPFAGLAFAIGGYVAAEASVASWLVKALPDVTVASATGALSIFGGGLALGRLLSSRIADCVNGLVFTVSCITVASTALVLAIVTPSFPLAVVLYGLSGLGFGPVYPMIMAMGGTIYPHRLATLSGGLAGAASVGAIAYPPLIGLLSARIGIGGGLIGAGLIGIPTGLALIAAHRAVRR